MPNLAFHSMQKRIIVNNSFRLLIGVTKSLKIF